MSKNLIPFNCDDVSALAKSLRKQLQQHEKLPTHVELLTILAKSIGLQNYQQLRQQHVEQLPSSLPSLCIPLPKQLTPFMSNDYILHTWPAKYSNQTLLLWFFGCRFQYQQTYSEQQVNEIIKRTLNFEDFALIRRELCNHKLLKRTDNGHNYWRAAANPPQSLKSLADYWPI